MEDFKIEYDLEVVNREFNNWINRQDFSEGEKAYEFIDEKGKPFQTVSMAWPNKKKAPDDYFEPLYHPINGKICPIPARGWRNPPKTMNALLGKKDPVTLPNGIVIKGEITFTTDKNGENNQPRRKYLLENNLAENTPSLFNFGASDENFFKVIGINFPYAKPLEVSKYLIRSIHPKPGIILDFFAGTGPALHACMSINEEDNKFIKCIAATNNEDNIADDCYKRNQTAIKGYKIERKNKFEYVPGLANNNLRYFRCEFVSRKSSIINKVKLTRLATELLCIKEDTYFEITGTIIEEKQEWIKIFNDKKDRFLCIIYDDLKIEDGVKVIQTLVETEKPKEKIKVYVFSNGQYPYTEDFEDVLDHIKLSALPDAIYKAYQNVLPKQQKLFIPELEEPTAGESEEALESEEMDLFNQPE